MCRILLVDDHITSREVTAAFLENEGHICTGVANGQEALDWLSAQTELPCIILLDLCMPVMNGWDFLRALRVEIHWQGISVVVVSGSIEQDGHPTALANAFWSKPLQTAMIRNLHCYCDRHRHSERNGPLRTEPSSTRFRRGAKVAIHPHPRAEFGSSPGLFEGCSS